MTRNDIDQKETYMEIGVQSASQSHVRHACTPQLIVLTFDDGCGNIPNMFLSSQ